MGRNRWKLGCSLALGLGFLVACGESSESSNSTVADSGQIGSVPDAGIPDLGQSQGGIALADFALLDTNPTSNRSGEMVSPRDYMQKVTGWYFTHAS